MFLPVIYSVDMYLNSAKPSNSQGLHFVIESTLIHDHRDYNTINYNCNYMYMYVHVVCIMHCVLLLTMVQIMKIHVLTPCDYHNYDSINNAGTCTLYFATVNMMHTCTCTCI